MVAPVDEASGGAPSEVDSSPDRLGGARTRAVPWGARPARAALGSIIRVGGSGTKGECPGGSGGNEALALALAAGESAVAVPVATGGEGVGSADVRAAGHAGAEFGWLVALPSETAGGGSAIRGGRAGRLSAGEEGCVGDDAMTVAALEASTVVMLVSAARSV